MIWRRWRLLEQIIAGVALALLLSGVALGSGSEVEAFKDDPEVEAFKDDNAPTGFHCKGGGSEEGMPLGSGHGGCDGVEPFCGTGYED